MVVITPFLWAGFLLAFLTAASATSCVRFSLCPVMPVGEVNSTLRSAAPPSFVFFVNFFKLSYLVSTS